MARLTRKAAPSRCLEMARDRRSHRRGRMEPWEMPRRMILAGATTRAKAGLSACLNADAVKSFGDNPDVATVLIDTAANLASQADQAAKDVSPKAPDVQLND